MTLKATGDHPAPRSTLCILTRIQPFLIANLKVKEDFETAVE